jgi:Beta-lactamase enzyme family
MDFLPSLKPSQSNLKSQKVSWLQFWLMALSTALAIVLLGLTGLQISSRPKLPSLIGIIQSKKPQRQDKLIELSYNVKNKPKFQKSRQLEGIINDIVNLAISKGLPIETLSISLIDLKSQTYAGYQDQMPRFPASVSKLFWMVTLYANFEEETLAHDAFLSDLLCKTDLCKMIQKSDNESASRILDRITDTTSGAQLSKEDYVTWVNKRSKVNTFFQKSSYDHININQKNFPIPYLKLDEPQGRDLQMRGNNRIPIRNQMTTEQASRLMYEIFTNQAVSPKASEAMQDLLTRDLRPEVYKKEQYNSVEGFLAESLPFDRIYFASKVGWTLSSRQEVAYITTNDGKVAYILSIFGDDKLYGNDWEIFPEISLMVFQEMTYKF